MTVPEPPASAAGEGPPDAVGWDVTPAGDHGDRSASALPHDSATDGDGAAHDGDERSVAADGHLRQRNRRLLTEVTRLEQRVAALREQLRVAERDRRRAEAQTTRLRRSASFRLGHSLVRAAKAPTEVRTLPRRLRTTWRRRGAGARPLDIALTQLLDVSDDADAGPSTERRRLVAHRTVSVAAEPGLSLAGIVTSVTRHALAPDAAVSPLLPHDADLVIDRTQPDFVLIESAAFTAPGPWAYAGTGVAVERDGDLQRLVKHAQALEVPVVFWWNSPAAAAPGLRDVAARCDEVVSADGRDGEAWTAGVQLAVYNPVGVADRHGVAHLMGRSREDDPRLLAVLRAADPDLEIGADDTDRGYLSASVAALALDPVPLPPPSRRPAWFRERALFVASPFRDASVGDDGVTASLTQLACGADVLSGPNAPLWQLAGEHVRWLDDDADPAAALAAALAADPVSGPALHQRLVALAGSCSTVTMLSALARRLGVAAPADRQSGVCVVLSTAVDVDAAVAAVLAQTHRPCAAVLLGPQASTGPGAAALERAGITTVAAPDGWDAARSHPKVRLAPWLAVLDPDRPLHDPDHFRDLLVGWECSRADAVGVAADRDLEFTDGLDVSGSLLRCDVVDRHGLPDARGTLDGWARQGARLFAFGAPAAAASA